MKSLPVSAQLRRAEGASTGMSDPPGPGSSPRGGRPVRITVAKRRFRAVRTWPRTSLDDGHGLDLFIFPQAQRGARDVKARFERFQM